MNKAWQLCIIDSDSADFSDCIEFNNTLNTAVKNGKISNGCIVYVVNSVIIPFNELNPLFKGIKEKSRYSFIDGVPFAYVWYPSIKRYGWVFQDILKPIITEQDIIEIETKFGISLEEYI